MLLFFYTRMHNCHRQIKMHAKKRCDSSLFLSQRFFIAVIVTEVCLSDAEQQREPVLTTMQDSRNSDFFLHHAIENQIG